MKHIVSLACAACCAASLALPVGASQMDAAECIRFGAEDFTPEESTLAGICITQLPTPQQGALMLGSRCLRPGDVLTARQVEDMVFVSAEDSPETEACLRYLPVFSDGLSEEATMTLSIRSRENKAPIAEDSAFETYKNLEVTGRLRVRDPEGQPMQFTVTRQPRRGAITIREDGSFTYTPKKNKVGVDSFTFTAADEAGKVSRETTVTVTILKPTNAKQYSDTAGNPCRFAAEWMKNTGIFVGESVDGNPCFSPDRPVNRGEFLTMLVKTLKLPTDPEVTQTGYADAPAWLRPYLAAAIRSGLISALPTQNGFDAEQAMTAEDAAGLLCSALGLNGNGSAGTLSEEAAPTSLTIAAENGFALEAGQVLTRADAAEVLYQLSQRSVKQA